MNRLVLVGLNHTTAPLAVRETLAFNAEQRRAAVAAVRAALGPGCEAVLLSTCNRVELYAACAGGAPAADALIGVLAALKGVDAAEIAPHWYRKIGRDVVRHLFAVASSLDSMVLGETQILGQVREAYDEAAADGAAGATLHPLFQRALKVGKQVMSQTPLAEGRVSVASVAVDCANGIFDAFADKVVLSVGAGKMAGLVLRHFAALRPGRLLVCNRDRAKAEKLAGECAGQVVDYAALSEHLVAADIVVCSTGAQRPIVTRRQFERTMRARRYKPVFLIDIALPRNVEPAVGDLDNVYLYNLDHLQQVVSDTRAQRRDAIDAAGKIVDASVDAFALWHRAREMGPVIDELYRRYHSVAQDELARTLNKLPNVSPAEKEHLEDFARRVVNKLLHDPVKLLRTSDQMHAPTAQYLHAMEMLFGLKSAEEEPADSGSASRVSDSG